MKVKIVLAGLIFLSIQATATQLIDSLKHSSSTIGRYSRFEIKIASAELIPQNVYNPYDSLDVDMYAIFTSPTGKKYRRNAFWMTEYTRCNDCPNDVVLNPGEPWYCDWGFRDVSENLNPADSNAYLKKVNTDYNWRIRFAPPEIGTWSYKIYARADTNLADSSAVYNFTVTNSTNKGFITVDTNHRYFRYKDDGEVFIPLGLNVVKNSSHDSIYNRQALSYATEMITQMEPYGGNLIRIMMQPYNFAIEWGFDGGGNGPRDYTKRQLQAFDLDSIFTLAEAKGAYIQLVLDHQDMFTHWWANHPYNAANSGGYIDSIRDFFTDNACKAAYKQKMRYIIARWGYSPHLFAYEPIQEVDLYGRFWPNNGMYLVRDWYQEMIQYGKYQDKDHLFMCSVGQAGAGIWGPNHDVSQSLFSFPELDFVNVHTYTAEYNTGFQLDYIERLYTDKLPKKPMFFGELGQNWGSTGIHTRNYTGTDTNNYYDCNPIFNNLEWHNTAWSTMFGGAACPALYWGNPGNIIHPQDGTNGCWGGQYQYLAPLHQFLENEPIFLQNPKPKGHSSW